MARQPAAPVIPAPRYPPTDTVSNFTQNGQCPLASNGRYMDQSNSSSSNKSLYYSASTFSRLMEADRRGEIISHYGDPQRLLKPTLVRYQNQIQGGHVAVVGTAMPWAEAILINLGAGRITTLEYRTLNIEHRRVVTTTPSQFAVNFLKAADNGNAVRYDCYFIRLGSNVHCEP